MKKETLHYHAALFVAPVLKKEQNVLLILPGNRDRAYLVLNPLLGSRPAPTKQTAALYGDTLLLGFRNGQGQPAETAGRRSTAAPGAAFGMNAAQSLAGTLAQAFQQIAMKAAGILGITLHNLPLPVQHKKEEIDAGKQGIERESLFQSFPLFFDLTRMKAFRKGRTTHTASLQPPIREVR
jgi:hypothetical protein